MIPIVVLWASCVHCQPGKGAAGSEAAKGWQLAPWQCGGSRSRLLCNHCGTLHVLCLWGGCDPPAPPKHLQVLLAAPRERPRQGTCTSEDNNNITRLEQYYIIASRTPLDLGNPIASNHDNDLCIYYCRPNYRILNATCLRTKNRWPAEQPRRRTVTMN